MVALFTVGLVTGCGTPTEQQDAPNKNKTINIGSVNWAECVAVSNLWKEILEKKGYEVNLTLKKFKMTEEQLISLEALINDGMEPQAAAQKWIAENKDIVSIWLN